MFSFAIFIYLFGLEFLQKYLPVFFKDEYRHFKNFQLKVLPRLKK